MRIVVLLLGLASVLGYNEYCKQNTPLPGYCKVEVKFVVDDRTEDETKWVIYEGDGPFRPGNIYGMYPSTDTDVVCYIPESTMEKFEVTDGGGDGVCCDHGYGSIRVLVNDVQILHWQSWSWTARSKVFYCPTFSPTLDPTRSPTMFPTMQPTVVPVFSSTELPTVDLTSNPSRFPTRSPSFSPTTTESVLQPSNSPSMVPSVSPVKRPTVLTTATPILEPSSFPTENPTFYPIEQPSDSPSYNPSEFPTNEPSLTPTFVPSSSPTGIPSNRPSKMESDFPTTYPTVLPTPFPSTWPSKSSIYPSMEPSLTPTMYPSRLPSIMPSSSPTALFPTSVPTVLPSIERTSSPTSSKIDSVPSGAPTDPLNGQSPVELSVSPTFAPTQPPSFVTNSTEQNEQIESTIVSEQDTLVFSIVKALLISSMVFLLVTLCICSRRFKTRGTRQDLSLTLDAILDEVRIPSVDTPMSFDVHYFEGIGEVLSVPEATL